MLGGLEMVVTDVHFFPGELPLGGGRGTGLGEGTGIGLGEGTGIGLGEGTGTGDGLGKQDSEGLNSPVYDEIKNLY